jgi:Ni,Fe-hydrogenase III small subunit
MLKALWLRLRSGSRTLRFPPPPSALPERFRGLPVVTGTPSPGPVAPDARGARVDLGASAFSPEESSPGSVPPLRFGPAYAMATRSRQDLIVEPGEVRLARALERESLRVFGRSLRLRSVSAGSCNGCEAELVALGNVVFDLSRFGVQFVASPRHADGLVVTGAVSRNMRGALEKTYAAMPDPRLVIAVGSCAISGGPFRGSPEVLNGVPAEIPVDLYIPGCPPHPLTVLDGLLRLLGRLEWTGAGAAPDRR